MRTLAPHSPSSPHVAVSELSAGYGGTPIIHSVSLTIQRGEVACVVGPNGAGKSTLLKALIGLLPALHGEVRLDGARISGLRADQVVRRGVAYVPQVRDVFEPLTVKENLELGATWIPKREVHQRLERVLIAYPQLSEMLKRPAGKLSGGERKMVAIGRVLMTEPTLVILDEPTAGLSPKLAGELLGTYVAALASRDVAVLLVEQRATEALAVSDHAYVMASGEVKIAQPAAEMLARDDLGRVFLGEIAEEGLAAGGRVAYETGGGGRS